MPCRIADLKEGQKKRSEVFKKLQKIMPKLHPLLNEQKSLADKIRQMRLDYELEYVQPQLKLEVLQSLDRSAINLTGQISELLRY